MSSHHNRLLLRLQVAAIVFCGGAALLLFIWFTVAGAIFPARQVPLAQRMVWDGLLSLLFFAQHSLMVRRFVRRRLSSVVPEHLYGGVYTIASAVALGAVVLLWQPTDLTLFRLEGAWRGLARVVSALALSGFTWAALSLDSFDPFGTLTMTSHYQRRPMPPPRLVMRGPYRFVRHPFYTASILLIWSGPDLTADRLLFNVLWTGWIVAGATLEERDLAGEFGAAYQEYRQAVPMLLPRLRAPAKGAPMTPAPR